MYVAVIHNLCHKSGSYISHSYTFYEQAVSFLLQYQSQLPTLIVVNPPPHSPSLYYKKGMDMRRHLNWFRHKAKQEPKGNTTNNYFSKNISLLIKQF